MANYNTTSVGGATYGNVSLFAFGNRNRRSSSPVGYVQSLEYIESSETAENLLRALANVIGPIMVKHGYRAAGILEFQPEDSKMSNLIEQKNVNSFTIYVRLRPLEPCGDRMFLHIDDISITVLGELAGRKYNRGTREFKRLNSQLQAEYCANQGIENVWKEFETAEVSALGKLCAKFKAFTEGL